MSIALRYTTNSTAPWVFCPCSACRGAGGRCQDVDWAVTKQWIVCAVCWGAGGSLQPRVSEGGIDVEEA